MVLMVIASSVMTFILNHWLQLIKSGKRIYRPSKSRNRSGENELDIEFDELGVFLRLQVFDQSYIRTINCIFGQLLKGFYYLYMLSYEPNSFSMASSFLP